MLIDYGNVAGMQPAVSVNGFRSGFGVIQIPRHDLRATHPELAAAANGLIFTRIRVDDAAFGIGDGYTTGAGAIVALNCRVTHRAEFGHAKALDHLATESCSGFGGELCTQRGGTGKHLFDR
ncbi:hypothetical protein N9K35_06915 [Pseudomonadales bacterium]|nr:hypothetical protein [Pseudomonadales bacterium]